MAKSVAAKTDAILKEALAADRPREDLTVHLPAITALRDKGYTWRQIADFLTERGVETDHTKIYRLMAKHPDEAFVVPEAREYIEALLAMKKERLVTPDVLAMLKFHWTANNRSATYTELSQAAADAKPAPPKGGASDKPATHRFANLHYGTFGTQLGARLGMVLPEGPSGPHGSAAIGFENPYKTRGMHVQLVMHHELAKALEALGWVTK